MGGEVWREYGGGVEEVMTGVLTLMRSHDFYKHGSWFMTISIQQSCLPHVLHVLHVLQQVESVLIKPCKKHNVHHLEKVLDFQGRGD